MELVRSQKATSRFLSSASSVTCRPTATGTKTGKFEEK